MKNYSEIFGNVSKGMKSTNKARTAFKNEYHSLSRLLRDAQQKCMMNVTAPIFEALGLPTNGKVKPQDVLDLLKPEQFVTDKKGNKFPAVVSRKTVMKDAVVDGQKIRIPDLDANGEKQYEYSLRAVKEGQWTIDKFEELVRNAREF